MKLLMTADAVGGVWTYALELCAALAEHEVHVVLATLGPRPTAAQCRQTERLNHVRLIGSDDRLEWMADAADDVRRSGDWLQQLAADEAVDLVHLNGYAHAALPWRRPTLVVAHSCIATWWRAVHGTAPPPEWHDYRQRVLDGLRRADGLVAPTHAFLADLRREYGPLTAHVIHNARDLTPALAVPAPERQPLVFACGRLWDEAKRLRTLAAVAPHLPWPVVVAGDARHPAHGRAVVPDGVTATGVLTHGEVVHWMQRASVFVHPACYEPFGLAVLEAALAGCALVLADLPSLRELWDGAALFVNADNPDQLRAALMELIGEPSRRRALGLAAQARALRFSPAVMAREYLEIYRRLLQRPSRAPRPLLETA